jgi:hypothetical protein
MVNSLEGALKKVLDLMHIKSVSSAWVFIGAFGLLLLTIVYEQIVSPSGMYAGSEDDIDAFLPVIGLIVMSLAYIGISSWALLSSGGRKLLAEQEKISDQTGRTIAWWPKFLFACIAAAFMSLILVEAFVLPLIGQNGVDLVSGPNSWMYFLIVGLAWSPLVYRFLK